MTGYLAHVHPSPVGWGRMMNRPAAAGMNARPSIPLILANEFKGEPMLGDTCSARMLSILNQPRKASGMRKTSQTKPAL